MTIPPPIDRARLVAALHHSAAHLDLKTLDLCFLAALYVKENNEWYAS